MVTMAVLYLIAGLRQPAAPSLSSPCSLIKHRHPLENEELGYFKAHVKGVCFACLPHMFHVCLACFVRERVTGFIDTNMSVFASECMFKATVYGYLIKYVRVYQCAEWRLAVAVCFVQMH